jgi:hypothetical protein
MAVLRLELDIESDVYPELYAQLASIKRQAARDERMRQLAATGLVWETVRIHGASVTQLAAARPASAAAAAAAAMPETPAASTARPAPAPSRSGSRGGSKAAAQTPAPPAPAVATDFVDLAISVVSQDPSTDAVPAHLHEARLAAAANRFPVLLDVVDTLPPIIPSNNTAMRHDAVTVDAPSVAMPVTAAAEDVGVQGQGAAAGAVDRAPLGVVAQRSPPRSRLIRMKERGLFKNG